LAEQVREALSTTAMQFAVRYYSVLKPVEHEDPLTCSLSRSQKLSHGSTQQGHGQHGEARAFHVDYSKRLGAFEVQVAVKARQGMVCHLLHSKLFKGVWPSLPALQHLLERLLAEARFTRLSGGDQDHDQDEDPPESPLRSRRAGKGRKGGRAGSAQGGGRRRNAEQDREEPPEMHAEFDQREPAPPEPEVAPEAATPWLGDPVSGREARSLSAANSMRGQSMSESSEKVPPGAVGQGGEAAGEDDEADAAFLQYQMRQDGHERRGPVQRPPPSSFGSSDGECDTIGFSAKSSRKGVTKAVIAAVGAATNGLNALRNARPVEAHATKISLEEAAQIAAGLSGSSSLRTSGSNTPSNTHPPKSHDEAHEEAVAHPDLHKKYSAIGVLNRQNAGAGANGRYLHIPDEESSVESSAQPTPQHQQQQQQHSPLRLHPSLSPTEKDRPAPPISRSASRLSQQFKPTLAALVMSENEDRDDEQPSGPGAASSPTVSNKSLTPVATVVQLTTTGLQHVRQRAASVSTAAEKMAALARTGRGVTQSEKIQSKVPVPQPTRTAHPSLEMRKKLEIGTLSRQNAGKVLVVPGDSSSDEDEAGRDDVAAAPNSAILAAMSAAVHAVDLATAAEQEQAPAEVGGREGGAVPTHQKRGTDGPPSVSRDSAETHQAGAAAAPLVSAPGPLPTVAADSAPTVAPSTSTADLAYTLMSTLAETPSKLTAAEILQSRRKTVDKLLLEVSHDILDRKGSALAEYGEDFEDFSPSGKQAADGYEDLFEGSDFKLPDEDSSAA
jgi:hypothetical protein